VAPTAQHLLAQPDLAAQLSALQAKGARLAPLLRLLLSALAAAAASPDEPAPTGAAAAALLRSLVLEVDLQPGQAREAAAQLLDAGAGLIVQSGAGDGEEGSEQEEEDDEGGAGGALRRVRGALRALDLRHPEEVDAAVNAALTDARRQQQEEGQGAAAATPAAPTAATPKGGKKGKAGAAAASGQEGASAAATGGAAARREALFRLVQACFGASAHAPVDGGADADSDAGEAQTLAAAVHAPAEGVRIMVSRPAFAQGMHAHAAAGCLGGGACRRLAPPFRVARRLAHSPKCS
jgi:hypothetical protein